MAGAGAVTVAGAGTGTGTGAIAWTGSGTVTGTVAWALSRTLGTVGTILAELRLSLTFCCNTSVVIGIFEDVSKLRFASASSLNANGAEFS